MTTQKCIVKRILAAVAVITLLVGAGASSAVGANPSDMYLSAHAKQSVICFVYARAQGLDEVTTGTFIKRIGKAKDTAGAIWTLGHTVGLLDAYGYANASRFGSAEAGRVDAARALYKMSGCTINEAI
jgi:hypothetical protein